MTGPPPGTRSRDPGVYSRPGAASVRPSAMWDAIYELSLGNVAGITPEGAQALIDDSIAIHEGKDDPHPVYLTEAEGDIRYGGSSGLSPHAHIDASTGGVIDYLRTQWGTDHVNPAGNPHTQYLRTPAVQAMIDAALTGYYTKAQADARYLPIDYVPPPSGISQADADLRYVNTAGDVMTGSLTMQADLVALTNFYRGYELVLGTAGVASPTNYLVAGVPRWDVGRNAVAETGSNAGSDFYINRYGDGGTLLGSVLALSRATGAATFGGTLTANAMFTLTGGLARVSSQDAPLRLNTGTGDLMFERTGGQVGSFRASDNFFTADIGAIVAGKAVALDPLAGNTLAWNTAGFYSNAPTKAQYDALLARVVALEGQMGAGATGHYHPMGTWRQTAKAVIPVAVFEEAPAA